MADLTKGETALHANPFWVLGVNTRDDRRRIVERAEERALLGNADLCQMARSNLTSPRLRLQAEIAWMPGVSPRMAETLVTGLLEDPVSACSTEGLPDLAHANLLAAALELISEDAPTSSTAYFIRDFASRVDLLDSRDVMRDINEDRLVSGFPEIPTIESIDEALAERRTAYRNALKNMLDLMPSEKMILAITEAINDATNGGTAHGPALLDDLIDSYEVEAQEFLNREYENLTALVVAARAAAPSGERALSPILDKLALVARNWDRVAQPIQLSYKSRGSAHRLSHKLAYELRSLGIDLFNQHDLLDQANRVTKLLQELFSELPEVAERVEQDAEAITDLRRKAQEREKEEAQHIRDITFRSDVGAMFKEELSISPAGISWQGTVFPLNQINRIRYGAIRHSINGIPTGTDFTICFGDNQSFKTVKLRKEATYTGFTSALWNAVGVRIMLQTLEALKSGQTLSFGNIAVEDSAVTLPKHKFFGSHEPLRLGWGDVRIWSADGNLVLGSATDKKTYGTASFKDSWNTHILDALIRTGFKKGINKLSEILK